MNINSRTSKVNFTGYASGSIASFTGLRAAPIKVAAQIVPIQSGSGDPSPDNIRPISGVSECNVVRCGVNVWDEETIVSSSRIQSKNYISVKPSTQYRRVTPENIYVTYFDIGKNDIGHSNWGKTAFTTPDNCYYIKIMVDPAYGTTYNNDISINYPSTDTDYHAYTGNTYTIQLGDTYYGGSLNVTNGVLTVTDAKVDMGTLEWNKTSASQYNLFRAPVPNIKEAEDYTTVMSLYCEIYKTVAPNDRTNHTVYVQVNQGHSVDVIDNDCNDVVELKNRLNGVKLVYPLATPVNIQLTPTQINQIIGTNNIFSDSGNVEVFFVTI